MEEWLAEFDLRLWTENRERVESPCAPTNRLHAHRHKKNESAHALLPIRPDFANAVRQTKRRTNHGPPAST
ncbi:hypothetical protein WS69_03030 [Burkholderia sp. BDU5]|nr:hypothetical protein WS69_03030 [Burkholderia sp. BDU5]